MGNSSYFFCYNFPKSHRVCCLDFNYNIIEPQGSSNFRYTFGLHEFSNYWIFFSSFTVYCYKSLAHMTLSQYQVLGISMARGRVPQMHPTPYQLQEPCLPFSCPHCVFLIEHMCH